MEVKADIEQYKIFYQTLCAKWADTYNCSDKDIHSYISHSTRLIDDLDAITECEFLFEMLDTNCRHNNYGSKNV